MSNILRQYEIFQNEEKIPYIKEINKYILDDFFYTEDELTDQMQIIEECIQIGRYEAEHDYIIARNSSKEIKGIYQTAIGGVNEVIFSRRNIALFLALLGAYDFFAIHNHPNGVLDASEGDLVADGYIKGLGNILEIPCIGTYIITDVGWVNVLSNKINYFNE